MITVHHTHHAGLSLRQILEHRNTLSQTHGSSLLLHIMLKHRDNHRVSGGLGEFLRVGIRPLQNISIDNYCENEYDKYDYENDKYDDNCQG